MMGNETLKSVCNEADFKVGSLTYTTLNIGCNHLIFQAFDLSKVQSTSWYHMESHQMSQLFEKIKSRQTDLLFSSTCSNEMITNDKNLLLFVLYSFHAKTFSKSYTRSTNQSDSTKFQREQNNGQIGRIGEQLLLKDETW